MANRQMDDSSEFFAALEQIRATKQKELLEDSYRKKEQDRLNWIEFRRSIDTDWLPMLDEFLTALGRLWFGFEDTIRGASSYRPELVTVPAYVVANRIFGPMAIHWVAKRTWLEREVPYGPAWTKTELYTTGFRCRVIMQNNEQYRFETDDGATTIYFARNAPVDPNGLNEVFAEAYRVGPGVLFNQWRIPIGPEESNSNLDQLG